LHREEETMAIRDSFKEELDVELTDEERNIRGRQTARLEVALQTHRERTKELQKERRDGEKELEEALTKAAKAAETGQEKRFVECHDELRGSVVTTKRNDTGEVIGTRGATREELGEHEKPPMHGGGAKKAEPRAKGKKTPPDEDGGIGDDNYSGPAH
jgi:hypothetical protein